MTVFNESAFLPQALTSILRQEFDDFELIAVNDGSTDDSHAILQACGDRRLVIVNNRQNIGQTRSLNLGLEIAQGRFIARQDADDISHPKRLSRQVAFLRNHLEVGLLGTNYEMIDERGRVLDTVKLPLTDSALRERLLEGNVYCHGSVMMRSDELRKVNGYREQFPVTQDFDLWLRLAEVTKLANLPEALYQFRFRRDTVSRKSRPKQLSYKALALDLARQRKEIGQEKSIPRYMEQAYPPAPADLLRAFAGNALMFFIAGELEQASQELHKAEALAGSVDWNKDKWEHWVLASAQRLAVQRKNPGMGEDFILWCCRELPAIFTNPNRRVLLGKYFAWQVFRQTSQESGIQPLTLATRAVMQDPSWLLNRGIWSQTLRSLLRP